MLTNSVNNLCHKINTTSKDGDKLEIVIRLSDECQNGQIDFSITGTIYEKGKPKTDRYLVCCGCIHEEILAVKPELNLFVDLHLSDAEGVPMYAVENGFYHLKNGFNSIKPNSPEFITKFCKYYRMNEYQYNIIKDSKTATQYALNLVNCGIVDEWKKQAEQGIKLLEEFTGKSFFNDGKKSNLKLPTQEEINAENQKILSGYYSKKEEKKREKKRVNDVILKIKQDLDKKIKAEKTEFLLKKQIILIAGEEAEKNSIFYNHSQTLAFNWCEIHPEVTPETIAKITAKIKLPEGIKIENKNKFKN